MEEGGCEVLQLGGHGGRRRGCANDQAKQEDASQVVEKRLVWTG